MTTACSAIIFLNESDRTHHRPVVDYILQEALKSNLSGATAFRAIDGFGAHLRLHRSTLLSMTDDEGVMILIVDLEERLHPFLEHLAAQGVSAPVVLLRGDFIHLGVDPIS
ncbi:MAG: DUF190 domain-containing protein [Ferrimicrobium sp.]